VPAFKPPRPPSVAKEPVQGQGPGLLLVAPRETASKRQPQLPMESAGEQSVEGREVAHGSTPGTSLKAAGGNCYWIILAAASSGVNFRMSLPKRR